ncbi:MAG: GNAT family N-acetyltransferase [Anaerolineaceae bacterium]|nr:GNAT family N-acetyltransferase [Anaerolineaceae bacterium]
MDFYTYTEFSEEIKTEWNAFVNNGVSHVPFLRYEYLKDWWSTRGGGEWPQEAQLAIIVARENERLIGIAPCFIAPHEGHKALLLLGSIEISDYLDLLIRPQDLSRFSEGLIEYARTTLAAQHGLQTVDFYNLIDSSPSVHALPEAAANQQLSCDVTPLQRCPYIPLSGNWEEYLNGIDKKQRHEIRRKMRRALELVPAADWYIASDPARIDTEIEDFLRLMAYDAEKEAFLTPAMREQMALSMREAFNNGLLQLAFLTIGEEKAAAYLNFDYSNRIWVYNSGLNPNFSEYSPGWVLLAHLIKWANENNRFEFDFMRGNEEYKYRFGAIDHTVQRVTIYL